MYLHLYLFWLKRLCYLVLTCQRLCICFGADYESLLLLCAVCWYASCGSGCLCLRAYHRGDVTGKCALVSMAHSYCRDIYVARGFYFRMIATAISPCFLYIFCVFYVSFLELVIVLSSKYYFVCLASIWHLVGVDCVEIAFRYSYFI